MPWEQLAFWMTVVFFRKMELILRGEVSVEYWWNLPLVKPIQIVNS